MAWMEGTVRCQCEDTMGMPWDSGVCQVCDKTEGFSPTSGGLSALIQWAREHSKTHEDLSWEESPHGGVEVGYDKP